MPSTWRLKTQQRQLVKPNSRNIQASTLEMADYEH